MDESRSYYEILEIPESASHEQAYAAYRKLVREYHPDRLVNVPEDLRKLREHAEAKWQEIQQAWAIVGNSAKRSQYDAELRDRRQRGRIVWPAGHANAQTQHATPHAHPPSSPFAPPGFVPPGFVPPIFEDGFSYEPPNRREELRRARKKSGIRYAAIYLLVQVPTFLFSRLIDRPPSWLTPAMIVWAIGAALLIGLLAYSLREKAGRANAATAMSLSLTLIFAGAVYLVYRAKGPRHPNLHVSLPLEEKMAGYAIGYADGIHWTRELSDRGAAFSAADSSRIEYPGVIPAEGTLEFWINVKSGYSYSRFMLHSRQDVAMIFSSDPQGGDIPWPGASKLTVSRSGIVSFWMATGFNDNPHAEPTQSAETRFRFGEWHALGVSYGRQGQSIMLDGEVVANDPDKRQTFGRAGNHQQPLDVPTIGETESHYWTRHRVEGGFEGTLAGFRVSAKQQDWVLARGVKDTRPALFDRVSHR